MAGQALDDRAHDRTRRRLWGGGRGGGYTTARTGAAGSSTTPQSGSGIAYTAVYSPDLIELT